MSSVSCLGSSAATLPAANAQLTRLSYPEHQRKLRWLCISADGARGTVQADKRTLISKFELGIPIRDMRLLDSTLVTTSRGYIAVRENAIVFAIECALRKQRSA